MPTLQPIDPRVPRLYIVTVLLLVVFGVTLTDAGGRPRVMIAVNAGGPSFVASDDAVYEADRYHSGGEASDFGIRFPITGTKDPELYQTERYASNGQELVYTLPMPQDIGGTFVLNLRFSEVYFEQPGKKVFGLEMNGLKVIRELDIFERVGFGAAYDENIEFKLNREDKTLTVGRESVPYDGQLLLRFVSVVDNPKVNALLVAKGTLADYRRHQKPKKQRKKETDEGEFELTLAAVCLLGCFFAPLGFKKYKELSRAYNRSKRYS